MRPTRNGSRWCRAGVPGKSAASRRTLFAGTAFIATALGMVTMLGAVESAAASPLVLSDQQLDDVTAGGMPVVTMNGSNIEVAMDIGGGVVWAVIGVGNSHNLTIQNAQRMFVLSGASANDYRDGARIESSSYAMASTRNGTASATTSSEAGANSASSSGSAQASGSGGNQAHSISFTSATTDQGTTARSVSVSTSRGGTASTSSSSEVRSDGSIIYAPAVGAGATLGAFAIGGASGYSFAQGQSFGSVGYVNAASSAIARGGSTFVVSGPSM